jgi:hypothetical protein
MKHPSLSDSSQAIAQSQDTGFAALVRFANSWACEQAGINANRFSVKEKDEASPLICFRRGRGMPSFSVLPGSEVFFGLRAGLQKMQSPH